MDRDAEQYEAPDAAEAPPFRNWALTLDMWWGLASGVLFFLPIAVIDRSFPLAGVAVILTLWSGLRLYIRRGSERRS
jgi:hypothetical protein